MKTLLLFPPVMWNFGPYLSLPSLAAFLRHKGREVYQKDLNAELYDVIFSAEGMTQLHSEARARFRNLETRNRRLSVAEREEYLTLALGPVRDLSFYRETVEQIKASFRDIRNYELADGADRPPLAAIWKQYCAIKSLIIPDEDFLFGLPSFHIAEVFRYIEGPNKPLYHNMLQANIADAVQQIEPGLIGITFSVSSQIFPGLLAAYLAKKRSPESHVIVGGPVWTILRRNAQDILGKLPFIDSIGLYDGENTLLHLADSLESGKEVSDVCNVVTRHRDRGVKENRQIISDLDHLPCPDYDGLNRDLYFTPYPVLTYATARGCYHNQCAFCNFQSPDARFRTRSPELICEDLLQLRSISNLFYFSQECETPARFELIADHLLARGVDIKYQVFARFDKGFNPQVIKKLKDSGCRYIFFGLESASQRVNDLMRKKVEIEDAGRIINDCFAVGQNIVVSSIQGFPGETERECAETGEFYDLIRRAYGSKIRIAGSSHFFRLARGSKVDKNGDQFGLRTIFRAAAGELSLTYPAYDFQNPGDSALSSRLEQYRAKQPEILFNEHIVLIISAMNDGRDVQLSTVQPRTPSPERALLEDDAIKRSTFLLEKGASIIECVFDLGELQTGSRRRHAEAARLFYDEGNSVGNILHRFDQSDGDGLHRGSWLLVANVGAGKSIVVSSRMMPLLELLREKRAFADILRLIPTLALPEHLAPLCRMLSQMVGSEVLRL
jgi:radical SAM superfamily enzyme YgiQ (UPF0313 family)